MENILYIHKEDGSFFPNDVERAALGVFEYNAQRMGAAPTITGKVKCTFCLDDLWKKSEYVEFRGERFYVKDTPSSTKDNTDTRYEHDITFRHERSILDTVYMRDVVFGGEEGIQPEADKYVSNSTKVIFWGNISEFVGRINACLNNSGLSEYSVVVDADSVDSELLERELLVSIEDKYLTEALQEVFNLFKIPYYWIDKVCHFGESKKLVGDFVFQYGANDALLSVEKSNSNGGYCNRATGVGSNENIPYYYPREREPNYTKPHAVEGNKGITDDSRITYIDAEGKAKFDKLEAVVPENAPWDGMGIVYDGGSDTVDGLVCTEVRMLRLSDFSEILTQLFGEQSSDNEKKLLSVFPKFLQNEIYLPSRFEEKVYEALGLDAETRLTDLSPADKLKAFGKYAEVEEGIRFKVDGACNRLTNYNGLSFYRKLYADLYGKFRRGMTAPERHEWRWWYGNVAADNFYNTLVCNFLKSTPFCLSLRYSFVNTGNVDTCELTFPVGAWFDGTIRSFEEKSIDLYLCDRNGVRLEDALQYSKIIPISGNEYDSDGNRLFRFRIVGLDKYASTLPNIKTFYLCLTVHFEKYNAFVDKDAYYLLTADERDDKANYVTDYQEVFGAEILDTKNEKYDTAYQAYHNTVIDDYVENHSAVELRISRPTVATMQPCWHEIGKLRITDFDRTLSNFGIASTQTPVSGDRIVRLLEEGAMNDVPTQQQLMPSIYRGTSGVESFYNALNEDALLADVKYSPYKELYKDESGAYREYENEFFEGNPHEAKFEFADIKPTIKGIVNADGKPIDHFVDVAFDDNDHDLTSVDIVGKSGSDDYVPEYGSESEYDHPYFFAKLARTYLSDKEGYSFNLFDSASPEIMTISPTKGKCGGCRFTIIVDEETKKNPVLVNEDGSLMRDKNGRVMMVGQNNAKGYDFQSVQQNTKDREVWICLQKETDTYGILMPNATSNLRPTTEDTFVLLDIYLPVAYIKDAEDRLSKAIIKAMWENNSEKFSFSINLSRIFAAENRQLFLMIDENSRLNIGYNGKVLLLPISSYTYKVDENSVLPEISVDLDSEVEVSAAYSAASISGLSETYSVPQGAGGTMPVIPSSDDETKPKDTNLMSAKRIDENYLSKVKDDIVRGFIEFLDSIKVDGNTTVNTMFAEKNVVIGNFLRGLVGASAGVDIKANGDIYARRLFLEDSLVVPTVDFNKAMVMMGLFIVSPACGQIETVDKISDTEGWATLKLEDGEYGSIAVGDMLLGFWNSIEGSIEDKDGVWNEDKRRYDRNGNYEFAGCASVYFLVTEIDSNEALNKRFRYQLRSVTDRDWGQNHHPIRGMKFFGFGNRDTVNHADRQNVYIITREYSVRLFNKADWTFSQDNIVEISGKLDGFYMNAVRRDGTPYVKEFEGTGHVIGNGYFFGTLDQFERAPYITSSVLYYAVTSDDMGKTDYDKVTWSTDPSDAKMDENHLYLYQYWLHSYSDGSTSKSEILRIGNFSEDSYNVEIMAIGGSKVIRNGQGSIVLKAFVYKGTNDVTDDLEDWQFSWVRISDEPEYDEGWNERHNGVGNTVTVTAEDVNQSSIFECIIKS